MLTIAKLSFKEILYKRIFLIAVLMTLAFLVLYGIANHYASKDLAETLARQGAVGRGLLESNMLSANFLTLGLFFSSFITTLLAVLASVGSLSSEIESHQIDTLLARPLRRRDLVLGKFIGLGGMIALYAAFLFFGILLVNFWFGGILRAELGALQVLEGVLFFMLQPLIITAAAIWMSSRSSTINGGIILIILYVIGFIGGFVEQFGVVLNNTALKNIGILSSLIFPTDSIYRKTVGSLLDTGDNPLSVIAENPFGNMIEPSALMMVYAILYGVLAIWFAIRKFSTRDL